MIGILGAGAVGLGLGSCLLTAGERVLFATRTPESADRLAAGPVARTGLFGDASAPSDAFSGLRAVVTATYSWPPLRD